MLAGPVFHRWHHTAAERGGEKNFASTFPVLDLMFGTFYMPKNALPDAYGVADQRISAELRRADALSVQTSADCRDAAACICSSFTIFASTRHQ